MSVFSYIVAAGLDGGTQVISFILNFVRAFYHPVFVPLFMLFVQAVFGAAGTAHPFPEWWGNGKLSTVIGESLQPLTIMPCPDLNLSTDRCILPDN